MNWRSSSVRYLLQEGLLFLGLSYILLLGGTFNGLVLYELNFINALLMTFGLGAWVVWGFIRRRSFPATFLDLPILALALATLLTAVFSSDPRRSAIVLWQLLAYICVFYLLMDLLRRGLPAELMVKVILLTSAFIVFFGIWEIQRWFQSWLSIAGWSDPFPPATLRVRAFLGHPNFVAAYFVLLLPLAMARWVDSTKRAPKILLSIWLLISLLLLFFTSSRGGWLGAAAAVGSFVLGLGIVRRERFLGWWHRIRRRRVLLVSLGVFVGLVGLSGVLLLSRQASHPTHGTGLSSRSNIWNVAFRGFFEDPLTGMGPFTYGTAFIEDRSVPPGMLLAHAHSYLLNTAAEMGLIGLSAVGAFIFTLSKLAFKVFRRSNSESPAASLGLLAGLIGFSVHSLFDTPTTFPALNVLVAGFLAILCQDERIVRRPWVGNASTVLLLGTWILVVGGIGYRLWSYRPHVDGVFASSRGAWQQAADRIAVAAERDPSMAFYWFQSGFAEGMAVLSADNEQATQEALDQAITDYYRGLNLEPTYGTNWANLGVLLWEAGDRVQAVRALEKAVEMAPHEGAFFVTLGWMYEASDRMAEASTTYKGALDLRPYWSDSYFFRNTSLRKGTVRDWSDGKVIPPVGVSSPLDEGWELLERGDALEAAAFFQRHVGLNTPEAYYGLGRAYAEQECFEDAVHSLRIARFLPSRDGWLQAMIDLSLADAYWEMGWTRQALEHYQRSFSTIERTTSLGVGMLGISDYGWYIYNRTSIAEDLLPGVEYIQYTDTVIEAMYKAAGCYEELGREAEALALVNLATTLAPDIPPDLE